MAAVIDLVQTHLIELRRLCGRHHVQRLSLFGSAASGTFNSRRSDIDLLVRFRNLAPADYADAYFSLTEELEHLFGQSIDLIEEDAIRNPVFRKAAEESSIVLYDAA
jgi:predicted nucleotidyltransferase